MKTKSKTLAGKKKVQLLPDDISQTNKIKKEITNPF